MRVPLRFLFASKPDAIGPVLGIVHRVIAGWMADQTGIERATAQCGAVTLIQRFGSALNLNMHFHMLWLDGVYEPVDARPDKPRLRRTRAPTSAQLTQIADTIARRVFRHLARKGWLKGEHESAFLSERGRRRRTGRTADELDHLPHRHRRAGRVQSRHAANAAQRRRPTGGRCRQGWRVLAARG